MNQSLSLFIGKPPTSTWPHLRCRVGLEEGEYQCNCLCAYSIVCYYNGAQRYGQFLQVGRLYRALIFLGLALSSERFCVFGIHGVIYILKFFLLTSFSLPFSELSLVDRPLTCLTNHCPSVL